MRRFRDIVEDIKAPSPQSLWLDKGKLKFFGTKGWTLMAGEEKPDLSGYAKLSGATFTGKVIIDANLDVINFGATGGLYFNTLGGNSVDGYIICTKDKSPQKVFASNGSLQNIGSEESFVFTLEDGSKVTKSIRVVSTTTTPAT